MLREHGAQRPHVFEILDLVHRLRGTKSRYTYIMPSPQPLSPRSLQMIVSPLAANPVQNLAIYRPPTAPTPSAGKNVPAPNAVEVVMPMRRGRPSGVAGSESKQRPSLATQENVSGQPRWPDNERFKEEEEKAWDAVKKVGTLGALEQPSTMKGTSDAWKAKAPLDGDTWSVRTSEAKKKETDGKENIVGFGDDFFAPERSNRVAPSPSSATANGSRRNSAAVLVRPSDEPPHSVNLTSPTTKVRDAFEGLGFRVSDKIPAPTLGAARKLRTGLAVSSGAPSHSNLSTPRLFAAPASQSNVSSLALPKSSNFQT